MDQKQCRHGGLGFAISPRMNQFVSSYGYVSDRVAVMDLKIPSSSGQQIHYRIVNAYGPTSKRVLDNPQLVQNFYETLSSSCDVPSRYEFYVMGDLNAKLGKISPLDESLHTNINNHIGRYAVGTRNSNGEHLLNFLFEKDLFAGNTTFPHKCRHITTIANQVTTHMLCIHR